MANVFSKEFTCTVATLLKERCAGGNRTTREAIVAALGDSFGLDGSNLAVMVSLSLSTGAVQGFEARRGRTGGIYPKGTPNEKRVKAAPEAPEAAPEAVPEAPKAKRSRKAKAAEPTPEAPVAEAAPAEAAPAEAAPEPVVEPEPVSSEPVSAEPVAEPVVEG